MSLKKILKSKRGIALENAIIFLMVIFSLTALLTSLALLANIQVKIEKTAIENRLRVDEIGEDFIAALYEGEAGDFGNKFNLKPDNADYNENYDGYIAEVNVEGSDCTLTLWNAPVGGGLTEDEIEGITQNDSAVLLYITATVTGGENKTVTVTAWRYSN